MSKLLKFFGILVGVLVVLIVGAVLIVPMVVDPNDLKGMLVQQAERQTGRKLEITGDLQLSVFPWVGVEVAGVRLANAEGFGNDPFASVQKAAVRAKLMPLLQKRIEVDTLSLAGVELNLVRRADGTANWDDLAGKGQAGEAPGTPSAGQDAASPQAAIKGLSIGGVEIKDAKVSWSDRGPGQEIRVDIVRLATGAIAGGDPVDVHLELGVEGKAPQVTGTVKLDGTVELDQRAGSIAVRGLKLAVDAQGEALQNGEAHLQLESDLKVLLAALGADVKSFGLEATRFDLALEAKQPDLAAKLRFNAPIRIDGKAGRFQAEALTLVLDAEGKALQGGSSHTEFAGDLEVEAEALGAQIEGYRVVSKALKVSGDLQQPQMKTRFQLATPLTLDGKTGRLEAASLTLIVDAEGKALQGGSAHAELAADLEVIAAALGAPIKTYQVRSKAVQLKGGVKQPDLQSNVVLSTPFSLDGDSGRVEAADLRLDAEASGQRVQGKTVKGKASAGVLYGLNDGTIELRKLSAVAGDLNLAGDLRGRLGETPAVSGNLKLAEFNLRSFLNDWGIPVPPAADPKTLTRLAADLEVQSEGAATKVSRMLVTLDDSQIKGSAAIKGGATSFNLEVNSIDLDRYRPADGRSPIVEEKVAQIRGQAASNENLFPPETIAMLRGLNLDGVISVGHLVVRGLKADGVRLEIKAHGGKLELSPKVSKFYQGTFNGTTRIDVSGATPQIAAEKHLAGVQFGPLLHDISGEDRLSGALRVNSNLRASGNTAAAIKSSLDGKFDFRLQNGSVKGFNLAQMLREAKAKLSGGTVSAAPKQTDFSEMGGSATIQNGVVNNQDLSAKAPFLRVDGKGTVNIPQETLDYAVTATVVESVKGQGGKELDDLIGIPIPVRLTGSWADPQYKVDMERIVAELAKTKLKEAAQAELQKQLQGGKAGKGGGGLGDQLKKALPGGFKLPF